MKHNPLPKHARDNRADQLNRQHPAYHLSRGASPDAAKFLAENARSSSEVSRSQGEKPARDKTPNTFSTERK